MCYMHILGFKNWGFFNIGYYESLFWNCTMKKVSTFEIWVTGKNAWLKKLRDQDSSAAEW